VFDQEAEVFDGQESGRTGNFTGLRADDAQLEPDGFGADGDGGVDDGRNFLGAAEDVDNIDGLGNVLQARTGFRAEHFPFVGIDGNDAVADGLEIQGDFVAGAGGIGGEADNGDGSCDAEEIEDGIGGARGVVGEIDFHGRWLDAEGWGVGAGRLREEEAPRIAREE
jgi:hypothetical protein